MQADKYHPCLLTLTYMRNIFLAIALLLLYFSGHAQEHRTYCNPINIDYGYTPIPNFSEWGRHRATADPVITYFKGDYYLFSTNQWGYWWSSDLSPYFALGDPSIWINVVARYNYDTSTRSIWINNGQAGFDNPGPPGVANGSLVIGVTNNTEYLQANISQVMIYNRALSDDEIAQNYNYFKGRFGL